MSTRSGKRIHNSIHENMSNVDEEIVPKRETRPRRKRSKENVPQFDVTLQKAKKKNYVSYPSDEDPASEITSVDVKKDTVSEAIAVENPRKLRRHTLKEHNANMTKSDILDSTNNNKNVRVTRQTKRFVDIDEALIPTKSEKVKGKKSKKKSKESVVSRCDDHHEVTVKKSKKKKKGSSKKSNEQTQNLNGTNMSVESFHSATGSPMKSNDSICGEETPSHVEQALKVNNANKKHDKFPLKNNTRSGNKTFDEASDPSEECDYGHKYELNVTENKNRTLNKNESMAINELECNKIEHSQLKEGTGKQTVIENSEEKEDAIENAKEKETRNKNSVAKEEAIETMKSIHTIEAVDLQNNIINELDTFEKDDKNKAASLNSTFDKTESKINTTFDKDMKNNTASLNSTFDKTELKINTTFDKDIKNKAASLNSTFDKTELKINTTFDKDIKDKAASLNSTFDKNEQKNFSNSLDRSSLISLDATVNLTFDKNGSRISITSDDSKADNILNSTPVLIDSSIDETQLSTSNKSLNVSKEEETLKTQNILVPITPLKRQGTFTKESPDVIVAKVKTPVKQLSLSSPGSPGCTPFRTTQSSQKSIPNVTRSIDKPGRRSSLAEIVPRQTKVMFCSPVNNPTVVMQNKNKVIKSSLKGSSKSFVFDESALKTRAGGRKRSLTHDADETRAKRSRLGDGLQHSVDRLSRPRTFSAVAKLETKPVTPSKKQLVLSKPKSDTKRTKLPNFAALHQKQFERMESLDECQERKSKRARRLLTPNGALNVLERSSPKGVLESAVKPKETPTEPLNTPDAPKLKTLESLRSGYTRFGFKFKLNTEFNPFTVPSQNDKKDKGEKYVSKITLAPKTPVLPTEKPIQKRRTTLPSSKGATRKEAAKQTVMREKSFTSLSGKRNVTRTESRTIIKGVRTNRRFELQMKMRNID